LRALSENQWGPQYFLTPFSTDDYRSIEWIMFFLPLSFLCLGFGFWPLVSPHKVT